MKVLVIGLGSMGKRRIRLLKMLDPTLQIEGVEQNAERAGFVRNKFGIEVYSNLHEALYGKNVNCAIVSSSPLSHAKIINQCLQAGIHVFTELNLIPDMYSENISLAQQKQLVLFLSSTFLYREEIKYIMNEIKNIGSKLNYSYHVGQYLPDWHPWETYNDFFVKNKRTNGCRELLAIELPWLVKTFGKVKCFYVMKSKNTSLEIDYMDNYLLLFEHENGNKGMVAVDLISRKAVRNFEVFGEELNISWDGTPSGLKKYDIKNCKEQYINIYKEIDKLQEYSDFVIENAYKNELSCFFDLVCGNNNTSIQYTFQEDFEILKLIDKIEVNDLTN